MLWPAVFDYGDMGTDNLLGWDFVKLETEFKIRAYPELFSTRVLPYATEIIHLERDLDIETEACRDANRWPDSPQVDTPLARFRWLVLMIRRHATNHFGLLLERWPDAEAAYSEAIRAAGTEEFPRHSMAKQIPDVLIPAFHNLGREIQQKLANPDEFFGILLEQQA